jgi:hypothetical protein
VSSKRSSSSKGDHCSKTELRKVLMTQKASSEI